MRVFGTTDLLLEEKVLESNRFQLFIKLLLRSLRSSRRPIQNQSGQAVLEYILVLVVVVGIIMGIMYQFNEAFKKYVQGYFGEYVACLLETGELPSLGAADGASAEICNASFEPFSLRNGRPLISGSGGSTSSSSSNSQGRRGSSGGNQSASDRIGSQRPSSSTLSGRRVNRNLNTRNGETTSSSSANGSGADNKKNVVRKYNTQPSFNFRTQRKVAKGQIPVSESFKMQGEKKEEKSFSANINTKGNKSGSQLRAKKIAINANASRKLANDRNASLGLSFSDYMRYIIIFGLLIMIIIFFGGQLLQLKKGFENN